MSVSPRRGGLVDAVYSLRMNFLLAMLLPALFMTETPATAPASQPATRRLDLTLILVGTYEGLVHDGDADVPVTTVFNRSSDGRPTGTYTVGQGETSYTGTLDDFQIIDADLLVCRFTWTDRHGKGPLVLSVRPDGEQFLGRFGMEGDFATERWDGRRVHRPRAKE